MLVFRALKLDFKIEREGEGPGGLIPVTVVIADLTESCSSVG